jgi:ketosteroid isomerase-like protein
MSQENVEIAHRLVAAVDGQDLDLLVELTDPEVEWHSFFAQLREDGVYRGHDGIRQYMSDLAETTEVLHASIDDTLGVGELGLAVGRLRYRGKGSGIDTEAPAGYLLRLRHGRVVLMRAFRDPETAFQALGSE